MKLSRVPIPGWNLRRRAARALTVSGGISGSWLFARMAAWALILRPLKSLLPVRLLAKLTWATAKAGPRCPEQELRVINLVEFMYNRRDGACLERSLLLYRFLSLAHANPQLIIGLQNVDDGWKGHAWVVVDDQAVGESADALRGFAPLFMFASGGNLQLL